MQMLNSRELFAEVQENRNRLQACPRHRFQDALTMTLRFGDKMQCQRCGGNMSHVDVLYYVEGFKAAGGNPEDVWPNLYTPTERTTQGEMFQQREGVTIGEQVQTTVTKGGIRVPLVKTHCRDRLRGMGRSVSALCDKCGAGPCTGDDPDA